LSEPTLKSVAEQAKVHVATASRALDPSRQWQVRPETRAKVQAAAERLNYRPHALARGLRRGQSTTVGLIVADLGNPFVAPVIRGFGRAVQRHGLLPVIAETEDDSARLRTVIDDLLGRRVDALVITAAQLKDRPFINDLVQQHVPIVLASRRLPDVDVPTVVHDGGRGGQLAARHLYSLGHVLVGMIKGSDEIQSFLDRGDAFRTNAQALGVRVLEVEYQRHVDYMGNGREQMRLLLEANPALTGVFAQNDLMAVGAIDGIRDAGLRCPENVSVIGHDDAPLVDHIDPALTTIHTRGEELGRLAGEMVVAVLRSPSEPPQSLALLPKLITRRSTGPAPRDPSRNQSTPVCEHREAPSD
jgi:LacI family transcriptional regulator